MCRSPSARGPQRHRRPRRAGLSLAELLIATAIMAMVAGAMAALGQAVQVGWEYSEGHGLATQHARVALERMRRAVSNAYASETHPGVAVVYETAGGWEFPDTLVVWRPSGTPANPDGPPLVSECVLFCVDPESPNRLVEITAPSDSRPIPLTDELNTSTWRATLDAIKTDSGSRKVVLTNLLRVASTNSGEVPSYGVKFPQSGAEVGGARVSGGTELRGALRFERRLLPSEQDWDDYQTGALAWSALPWAQGIYGSQTGLRHVWVRIELQLMPGEQALVEDPRGESSVPVFGSAAFSYQMNQ